MKKFVLPAVAIVILVQACSKVDTIHLGGKTDPKVLAAFDGTVDTHAYDALLKKYVNTTGQVRYDAWKKSPEDMKALQEVLRSYANVDPKKFSRAQKLAFYINAYNAITLTGILHFYPTYQGKPLKSIGDIKGFWTNLLTNVGGKEVSLDYIEHKILRKMGEPRIHFTIVCASIGCPALQPWAYDPNKIEEQFTQVAAGFFADPQKVRLDRKTNTLYLTKLMKWFAADFTKNKSDAEKIQFAAEHMPAADAEYLRKNRAKIGIKYLDYDWNLNILRK